MPANKEVLEKMVSDVRKELETIKEYFKKEESASPKEESASASSGSPAPEGSASPAAAPENSAPASAPVESSASASGGGDAGGAPPSAPGQEAPPNMDELKAAFAQLPPDQLAMYFQAIQEVMQAKSGAMAPQGAAPMGPPSPSPAPAPGPGPASAAPMPSEMSAPVAPAMKSEQISKLESELKKSREEIEELKKGYEKLLSNTTSLVTGFEKLVTRPQRKSFTGQELTKTEEKVDLGSLSKSEITKKLNKEVIPRTDLSKSDRELINKYSLGEVKIDAIAKFFDKK